MVRWLGETAAAAVPLVDQLMFYPVIIMGIKGLHSVAAMGPVARLSFLIFLSLFS